MSMVPGLCIPSSDSKALLPRNKGDDVIARRPYRWVTVCVKPETSRATHGIMWRMSRQQRPGAHWCATARLREWFRSGVMQRVVAKLAMTFGWVPGRGRSSTSKWGYNRTTLRLRGPLRAWDSGACDVWRVGVWRVLAAFARLRLTRQARRKALVMRQPYRPEYQSQSDLPGRGSTRTSHRRRQPPGPNRANRHRRRSRLPASRSHNRRQSACRR
jgi:hypothetical protein